MSTTASTTSDTSDPAFPHPAISAILLPEEHAAVAALPPTGVQSWALIQVEDRRRRVQELERQISRFSEVHNALLPIHALPSEVFAKVLENVGDGFRDRRLGRVCRRWHAALLSAHYVWAAALATQDINIPDRFRAREVLVWGLEHTGSLPLHLRFLIYKHPVSSLLSTHAARLHTLEVMVHADPEYTVIHDICDLLCSGLPNLSTLIFDPKWEGGRDLDVSTFEPVLGERKLPRLRHLTLPFRPELFFLDPPPRLKSLDARGLNSDLGTLINYVTANSSTLTHLRIISWYWWDETSVRAIHLPHLKCLMIWIIHDFFHNVLNLLRFDVFTCVVQLASPLKFRLASALPPGFPGYHSAPFFDRLLLDYAPMQLRPDNSGTQLKLLTSCYYVQGVERLRVIQSAWTGMSTFESSLRDVPILALAVPLSFSPSECKGRNVHKAADPETVMRHLPHLRRLELLDAGFSETKCDYARSFLRSYGFPMPTEGGDTGADNSAVLQRHPVDHPPSTLAWVLALNRERDAIHRELESLVDVFATYAAERGGKWSGTLELYGTMDSESMFLSCIDIPTRPEACAGVVESLAAASHLQDLVAGLIV